MNLEQYIYQILYCQYLFQVNQQFVIHDPLFSGQGLVDEPIKRAEEQYPIQNGRLVSSFLWSTLLPDSNISHMTSP